MPLVLGHECYPVNTAPIAYDIVMGRFPYEEEPHIPGPDFHPCLVLNTKVFKDNTTGHDYATVQIMYGTSQNQKDRRNPWDYHKIHNYIALGECGLWRETYFCLDRVTRVLWCEEYFPNTEYGTPILGKMPRDHILELLKVKEVRKVILAQMARQP